MNPADSAEYVRHRYLVRDRVQDPETGMVGKVTNYWFDDQGQHLDIEWDASTMLDTEVVPFVDDPPFTAPNDGVVPP